jgi:TolB-like protein/tetratricopeptide (TPR) repeat protein
MSQANSALKAQELGSKRVDLVRNHLREVLESHAFAGSMRAQDFLRLVVEHALKGEVDALKERMIGVEMFGRPVAYDTANDSVVRVKASEVRKKLAQYYSEQKKQPPVRIELPRGSYVPGFRFGPGLATAQQQPEILLSNSDVRSALPGEETPGASPHLVPQLSGRKFSRLRLLSAGAVLVFGVIALISYEGIEKWRASKAVPEIRSIAVLPFQNLSGDPGQDYFADGVTEELIADLGQVSELRVISRTSAMSYKGTTKRVPEIARELGVGGVVEGSVLLEGKQIRITAQLIDAKTDQHIWARTYVRDITSVLALQGEMAQAIADEVSINVTPQEQARLARSRPVNPVAQDLYLQGKLRLYKGDFKDAIEFIQKAIDVDPNSAQAHAALADCYSWMGESGRMPYSEAFSRQRAEATKAVELDDSLSDGHVELADAAMDLNWDWVTAAKEFRRARELNPNSVQVHERYAVYLLRTGQTSEAVAEVKRALELDPVSGRSYRNAGFIYYFSRQYDQALALIERVRGLNIDIPEDFFLFGDIYAEKGMYAQSIGEFQKDGDNPHALGHLGNAYARAGKIDDARRTISRLEELVRRDRVGSYEIALVYAGLGNKDKAFEWLEDSYRTHNEGLTNLMIDPCLDPLRSDPRFADLVRRVGFTT